MDESNRLQRAAAGTAGFPAAAPKEQIRRIAYAYTFACSEARNSLAASLSHIAGAILKKPLYLRQVMSSEVDAGSDPLAVFEMARDAKAVAVFAVVEGWPSAKVGALSEVCARGGLLFRAISSAEVQKQSSLVDVILGLTHLSGEE